MATKEPAMRRTVDIGRRIELVPMDPHCHDITIGLYRQLLTDTTTETDFPAYRVHTYSQHTEATERIQQIIQTMQVFGGMEKTPEGLLYFPCQASHEAACRRVFLEACKLAPDTAAEPRPLSILDRKSQLTITVDSKGDGRYVVRANGEGRTAARRTAAIAGGLMKLGEMESPDTDGADTVRFACGHAHDALIGLLLVRAPNVRIALREEDMRAARGTLAAPSQQT